MALVFFYAPDRRRPGLRAEDLLRARADGDRGARRLRRRRRDRDPAPAQRRPLLGHALLRGDPPVDHPRLRRARDRARSGPRRPGATGGSGTSRCSCSFLIVFLLYCVYYPLRFSIEDPDRQARYSSVFAITAGAFVPLNFIAVRLAEALHPPARALADGRQPARATCGSPSSSRSPAMALLFVTLWKLELTAKHASMQLKRLRTSRARVAA